MKGNFTNIVTANPLVLVDFYAEWCGPCKMQTPILKELVAEIQGKVKVIKIDVEKNPILAEQQQVRSVPTLVLFKNGRPVWRQSGVVTTEQLKEVIHQNY